MHIQHVARRLGIVLALILAATGQALASASAGTGSNRSSPAGTAGSSALPIRELKSVRFDRIDTVGTLVQFIDPAAPVLRIVRQPVSQGVFASGSATLSVVAEGPTNLAYQWFLGTNALVGSTNGFFTNTTSSSLVFSNTSVTNAGDYSVVVSSGGTSVTSSVATLKLIVGLPSILRFTNATNSVVTRTNIVDGGEGAATTNTTLWNRHTIPVSFTIQGDDRAVALSLAYDPSVVSNLGFAYSTDINTNVSYASATAPGSLAFVFTLTNNAVFTNLTQLLGTLTFETPAALAPVDALRLARFFAVTDLPATNLVSPFLPLPTVTTRAYGTNSGNFPLIVVFQPQVIEVGTPVLDRQTGYFRQTADIVNIGPEALADMRLVVTGLTNDTRGVQVSLVSSIAPVGTPPNPSIFLGPLGGYSGPRRFSLEYYVSDGRVTSIGKPGYVAEGATEYGVTTTTGRQSIVPTFQVVTNGVVLEFSTLTNFSYYVRYSDTLSDFSAQTTNSTEIRTAVPAFRGNGRRVQWLDNGPPRTHAAPTNRFYRVLEFR
jgi:hypothetical protein